VIEAASALRNRAQIVFDAITGDLEERADEIIVNMGKIEPNGDEDEDPLIDSRRKLVEQTDRYKRHQGKPTERRARVVRRVTLKCSHCKKPFQTANSQKKFCSQKCQARAAQ
jgi:hypothetical protein